MNKLKCRVELCKSDPIHLYVDWKFENRLIEGGVKNINHALRLGESGLRKIYGVGDKCIQSINENLERYNIHLKQ